MSRNEGTLQLNETQDNKIKLDGFFGRYGTIGALLVIFLFFSLTADRFTQLDNLVNVIRQISTLAIVALGMTAAMASGEFDMSAGSVVGLAGVLVTGLLVSGMSAFLAILIALLVGSMIGVLNGLITTKVGIPSMIVTLGTSSIVSGSIYMYTKGKAVYGGIPAGFTKLGRGYFLSIPIPIIIMVIIALVMFFILNKTTIGRYIYSVGGNAKAAKLSGISTVKYKVMGLVYSGTFAAITGIILAARLGSGQPTAGESFTMDGLSAVFIGMTTIKVGRANVVGTLVGVALIGILNNGLNLLGLPFYVQDMAKGAIMIGAIAIAARKNELKFF